MSIVGKSFEKARQIYMEIMVGVGRSRVAISVKHVRDAQRHGVPQMCSGLLLLLEEWAYT